MATRTDVDPAERIRAEYGVNSDYVLELFHRFQRDPRLLDEDWRGYFARISGEDAIAVSSVAAEPPKARTRPSTPHDLPQTPPPPADVAPPSPPPEGESSPVRGAALQLAQNMAASLAIPTATSQRQIAVKLLDENRRLINDYRAVSNESKLSFTHLAAWAAVEALREFPRMNDAFDASGPEPSRRKRDTVNFGVAVDVEKKDGSRSLVVPSVKGAEKLCFPDFVVALDDIVTRARTGKLAISDFQGTTTSLTNPGPMGTTSSIARLMPGHGFILATGAMDYPPGFSAMAPEAIAELGISKVMTLSCTYDHRIIQGAESGMYLGRIYELLLGEHGFYDRIFASLHIPVRPLGWAIDNNPALISGTRSRLRELEKQARVLELINAYRVRGHLVADIDPLRARPLLRVPELDLETYGLSIWDLDREFITGGLGGTEMLPLRKTLEILRRSYCGKVGVEYRFIQDAGEKEWLRRRIGAVPEPPAPEVRKQILWKLLSAEAFEKLLHSRYLGQKRYSVEGCETVISMLDALVAGAAGRGVEDITIGMAHRGRLNVVANVIGHFCERIFASFEGAVHPDFPSDEGDVKYHRGAKNVRELPDGQRVSIELLPNPSHLEFVDLVAVGAVRAKHDAMDGRGPAVWGRAMAVLLHGDAAFAGQGIVAETFNLAQLPGYRTGGTIHIVINNQIGFTTEPELSRSSLYSTDMAKITQVPIFHVNADDPEAAHRVLQIALDYRQEFHKDVVIDLVGFRRHGHNEGDEPSYTQPLMYQRIREHPGVFTIYARRLIRENVVTQAEVDELGADRLRRYEKSLEKAREIARQQTARRDNPPVHSGEEPSTGVPRETLARIGAAAAAAPAGFHPNPKVSNILERRAKIAAGKSPADWSSAEALAFGSLLTEGTPVRLSGEDSSRGTFSQRHLQLHDIENGAVHFPLSGLGSGAAPFHVFDSSLSEAGVLGFEYGYSITAPGTLTLWEAQFGDFANAAQVIVDQFIASGEEKWGVPSRLVLLLPHGQEGQGPEHSSARLERFLEMAVGDNLQVCQPSTPAQYFHLLRRQMRRAKATPLVILTPKSLLRLPASFSPLAEMTSGRFRSVIAEEGGPASRAVVCSGKVFYELVAARAPASRDIAVIRLEQLAPFPQAEFESALASFPKARDVVWLQEEPENMGAWPSFERILRPAIGKRALRVVARPASSTPAAGSYSVFKEQQKAIVAGALSG